MVSHELRTPLSSIKGSAASAQRASRTLHPVEVRQFFRIIEEQADRMDDLISDLLDAGRIDSGTLSVHPEPLEVAALVDQTRTTYLSGGARQAMHIDLPADLPRVMADERRIVQVLNNLLSNAARHSRNPFPSMSARCATPSRSRYRSPTSVGASRRSSSRTCSVDLPTPAVAGNGPRRRGSGWALPSARGWWRHNAGRIQAESARAGMGTRFTFTLRRTGTPLNHSNARR